MVHQDQKIDINVRRQPGTTTRYAALCLSALLSSACEPPQPPTPSPPVPQIEHEENAQSGTTGAGDINEPIGDEDLKFALMHRLFTNGVFPRGSVSIEVDQGIVEISGIAFSLFGKRQAEEIVETTKGVRAYVDKMTVQAIALPDQELEQRVEQALLFDAATEAYEIRPKVTDGVVTLYGQVDSWAEHQLAEAVAASVYGIVDIENRLGIATPAVRSPQEIKADIEHRLENDVLVDAALVTVEVDAGKAKLRGIVGSSTELSRAAALAHVAGVSRVDTDLTIQWWQRDRFVSPAAYTTKSDDEIQGAVQDALRFDARVDHDDIEVHVAHGYVSLSGVVSNLRARESATETAENTLGVTRVRNYVRVDPENDLDDERLSKRVERALRFNPYLADWQGVVTAKNGIVYLNGEVTPRMQREQANAVASRVMGVTQVEDHLRVYLKEAEDMTLQKDVQEAIQWNVYIEPEAVNVATDSGMVTLSGEVDTLRAYREAAAVARAAGAEVVFNRLKLAPRTAPPSIDPSDT